MIREAEFTSVEGVGIFVGTWNVNGKRPDFLDPVSARATRRATWLGLVRLYHLLLTLNPVCCKLAVFLVAMWAPVIGVSTYQAVSQT